MNAKYKIQVFPGIRNRNQASGFTLVELLVVVIIIGVLSSVALPNFLKQVGKAREVELKNTVGTINRAQQAYHWEKRTFAQGSNDTETLETLLGLQIQNQYIDTYGIVANSSSATVAPTNNEYINDGTRAYAAGVFFSAGSYTSILCRSSDLDDNILPPTNGSSCTVGNPIE